MIRTNAAAARSRGNDENDEANEIPTMPTGYSYGYGNGGSITSIFDIGTRKIPPDGSFDRLHRHGLLNDGNLSSRRDSCLGPLPLAVRQLVEPT